ncbi:phosphate regulon sensor histidine kinase PhoR [Sulfuriflexus sp.]|uniref:phosphate regulon sensor histidine kinase PhoR n=1 Tax=Sulfuriflexus sp. TaxID=2015443 RepID=UPI0028CE6F62|nr:phosphate regulon sensor histidine kinase PhoR [Sulfuriflexus sp.]MDT8403873.1 phosphate regulon sensor histidine kinase PhoR [Sulfuriflexus sp.]
MKRGWSDELWRITFMVAAVLLLTAIFGEFFTWAALAGIGYLTWHLHNLLKLVDWINLRLGGEPPESSGIWEEVFLQLFRFRQRNRRRHKRLVSRLSRFQEAAQALPDAIIVMNNQGTIEWCNNAATRMLGVHTTNDLGQRILNLVRTPALVSYIRQAEFAQPLNIPSPVNEGMSLSIRIVPYGAVQRLLIARDITRMQRLEEMRRDFVANVSHEMRTPLTVICGYLELFAEADNRDSDEFDDVIVRMGEQASRLQSIIGDLLLLSRLEADTYRTTNEPVNIPQLLRVLVEEARSLSGYKNHEISLECDDRLLIKGNEQELRSAFSNLVFNAVNYTPADGQIGLSWYQDEVGAHFAVRDTGIGIPAQHIERLTERFYRVDVGRSRHSGGTGLGLAIVKHVLQRHRAHLHIESQAGQGSLFRCDFPLELLMTDTEKLS